VSDSVRAPHYPMPLPVIARSVEERELLTSLASVKSLFDLVERTDVSLVGVGSVGDSAPLVQDGIITRQEAEVLRHLGAVGEITGWAFDAAGKVLAEGTNQRVAAAPLRRADNRLVIGVAMGPSRRAPLRGALAGRLISGLVTDEATAEHLLQR
jgi:DNA-binding transcriptional regulator LsrR (DeoR family)